MINEKWIIIGVIIDLLGHLSYFREIIKGKIKPNKVTWLFWSLAPLIAFAAQIKQGVGLASLVTFSTAFVCLGIFISSFVNKKSFWKLNSFDLFCGLLSLTGLILWQLTSIANLAIVFAILADTAAAIPTIVKSYQTPETEDYKVYLSTVIYSGIALLTIKFWKFAYFGFPLYLFLLCILLTVLIKFRVGKVS